MNKRLISRRNFCKSAAAISVLGAAGCASATRITKSSGLFDRFFIMDTSFWENKLDAQAQADILKLVKVRRSTDSRNEWEKFPRVLETFDQNRIAMVAVYVRLSIDEPEVPAFVSPLIDRLKGRGTLIWLNVTSQKYKPSDAEGDSAALPLIREIAGRAGKAGLSLSLYHHRGDWIEKVSDAYRLAYKSQCDNVGCTFNLYHWLFTDGPDNVEAKARMVLPKLNCLTINGAMKNTAQIDVKEAILPLNEGDYDVAGFVQTFLRLGYRGPIGFQGYGIGGDIRTKLQNTVQAWREICKRA